MKSGKKNTNLLLPMMTVLCLLSILVMVIVLGNGHKTVWNFTEPDFEASAQVGCPEVPDGLGWEELSTEDFAVSVCGEIVLDGNTADIWLTNPEANTVWLKLRVLDADGNILGETGLIKPNEYVQTVTLETVPEVGTAITLKVMAYVPDTYHSGGAITINTVIAD